MLAAATAPAAKAMNPMTIQLLRPVATYSMDTNMAKNISDVPRSCCRTRTPMETIHTTMIGPISLMRGSWMPRIFFPPTASWSRWSNRYEAKKNARNSLANSLGWNDPKPGIFTQMRAPYCSKPTTGSIGDSNSTMPITMLTYENRRNTR